MENISEIISNVLASEMLAPSSSTLAYTLGYTGKASLYRLMKGTAGENAISHFCKALDEKLGISTTSLYTMDTTIYNASLLLRLMKEEIDTSYKDWPYHVVLAFINHDFEGFSPSFKATHLNQLLSLEKNNKDGFFKMLFYFYIRATNIKFYRKDIPPKQQCAAILEELGGRLLEIFPENLSARTLTYIYSSSTIYDSMPSVLWNLVISGGAMLEAFANPQCYNEVQQETYILPYSEQRNYWSARDDSELLLAVLIKEGSEFSGYYLTFKVDRETCEIKPLGLLQFLNEEFMMWRKSGEQSLKVGKYSFSDDILQFHWDDSDQDPTGAGNRWHRLYKKNSQRLREIDKSIYDDIIAETWFGGEGIKLMPEYRIEEMTVTNERIYIDLANGERYSIRRSEYPFLRHVSPDELALIFTDLSDGKTYIQWALLNHRLPFSCFKKE